MSVYLGLGSNLGDRAAHLAFARQRLEEEGVRIVNASEVENTSPVGLADQPDFLNQVVEVETELDPHDLLNLCKAIEWEAGRKPEGEHWGPRELDVDILIYHDLSINEQSLTIPHPALPEREFLHRELAQVAPILMADAVVLVRYDEEWPRIFEAEAQRLREALAGVLVRVDHVGSTAVPGLVAKAIIDIQVSVDRLDPKERFVGPLEELGYAYVPDPRFPTYPFFRYPALGPRLFHLHVALAGSPEELEHISFRDRLRADPGLASLYVELKRNLAHRYFADRVAYSNSKGEFIGAALSD
ncbi:MAG: 2-amino-4-hydroxy-6-hydroxymethyldihydropteridine diphosphokinase [Chloroflexota bacterium]|jgi:2-amino-4-hydroxy-6-hydroxymethyldihydropteridine diphosphokinase|nr:2-amino-4-hydroxy-6-hydroxymethyldihydropteridine diphosphokinase [Chloroflexota bacterium]